MIAYQHLADLLISSGRSDELEGYAKRALSKSRKSYEMREVIAAEYARVGDWERALDQYTAMLSLRPYALPVAKRVAHLSRVMEDNQRALGVLDEFIAQTRIPVLTWQTLGDYYRQRGEYQEALKASEEAQALSQFDDPQLSLRLGELYALMGDIERARAAFDLAIVQAGDPQTTYEFAVNAAWSSLQYRLADEIAAAAIRVLADSESRPFVLMRLRYALLAGERTRALQFGEQYLERGGSRARLVDIYLDHGFNEEAYALVLTEFEKMEFANAMTHLRAMQGVLLQRRGLARTRVSSHRLANSGPFNEAMRLDLARAEAAAGEVDEAIVTLDLSGFEGMTQEAVALRMRLLVQRSHRELALALAQARVAEFGGQERSLLALDFAQILRQEGAFDEAIDLLREEIDAGDLSLLRLHTALELEHHGVDEALAYLQSRAQAGLEDESAKVAYVESLLDLARRGYAAEAAQELGDFGLGQSLSLDLIQLEVIALSANSEKLAKAIDDFKERWKESEQRFELAELLLPLKPNLAMDLAKPLVDSESSKVARAALQLAVTAAGEDQEVLKSIVDLYSKPRFDKLRALLEASQVLYDQSHFVLALEIAQQALDMAPASPQLSQLLFESALYAGELDFGPRLCEEERCSGAQFGRAAGELCAALCSHSSTRTSDRDAQAAD